LPSGQINLGGVSQVKGGTFTGSYLTLGTSQTDLAQDRGGNVTVQLGTGGTIANTWTFAQSGALLAPGAVSAVGNVTGGNVLTGGLVSATGNVTGNYINGNGFFLTGIITSVANINNGTSNVNIAAANANVTVSVNGTSNVAVFASTGEYITGELSASGNVTGGNVLTGGLISATSTITSAANITGGNILTGGLISAGGNITSSTNVNTPNVVGATGLTVSTGSGDLALTPSGNINASNNYINNLLDPVLPQDAVSKQYVDNAVSSGITIHTPVLVESPTALNGTYAQGGTTATVTSTVAGNTVVFGSAISPQVNDQYWFTSAFNGILADTAYFVVSAPNTSAAVLSTSYNGSPVANITGATGLTQPVRINSGIGATLTNAGANATLTIDGVTLSNTNRVLIYTQANAVHNGVYVVSEAGNATTAWQLTRSTDTDVYGPKSTEELDVGDYFFVQSGDTGAGESYVMTAPEGTFIIGYNNLTFTQFSSSQVYTANTAAGLSLIGTVFNAKVDGVTTAFDGGGNISVKASANLTTPNIGAATGTSLNTTANITGGNLLTGGLISATSTITSAANITGGNVLTAGLISATSTITSAANITGGNVLTAGLVSATGNVTGNYILGNGALLTGVITSVANINNGTSNVTVVSSGGNITVGVGGTGNVAVFATTGEYITGELSASGNVTGGNLLTAGLISATSTITSAANIAGGNLTTGGLISATANVTGGNLLTGGVISATANVTGGNLLTGGVISATGNITGGNVTATNYYYANGVAIVNYTASTTPPASPLAGWQWYNTSTDVLYEYLFDGTDDYWVDVSSPAFSNGPAGNMSISGSLLPSANITYDLGSTTNRWKDLWLAGTTLYLGDAVLSASGTSVSLGTGNVTGGNVTTAGIVSATGNITGSYIFGNGSQLTGVDATQIINGTSNAKVSGSGGNIAVTIGGTANVGVFYTGGLSITGDLAVTGNATLSGNILGDRIQNGTTQIDIQSANGNANITVGGTSNVAVFTTAGMTITGNIENGGSNGTGNIGSASTYFNTIFGKATTAQYADLAENYLGDAEYAPGTVLDFDGAQEVTLSTRDSSKRVAGVVSTNPAHLMNSTLDGAHVTAVALAGRVPTQVTGKIAKGDLMVSAGNGRARAEANPSTGTVIGKALENFDGGEGTIEIVISMQ
jgi:hypothetical protein